MVMIAEHGLQGPILLRSAHEDEFVTDLQRIITGGRDHAWPADNSGQGGVGRPGERAHPCPRDRGADGQGDLNEIGLSLAEGEEANKVAHAHGFLNERGQHAWGLHCDIHAP